MDDFIACPNDAGCDKELIAEVTQLYEHREIELAVRRLRRHRCTLMDELHESQRKVDCLDFLLRKLSKLQIHTF